MSKYDKEYIKERMADFVEFRAALREVAGHPLTPEIEIMLYSIWKR